MKIITKAVEKAFQKQGYIGNKTMKEIKIVMKLFNPCGSQTWYLYEMIDNDIYMAFVNLGDYQMAESGTVSLSEIMSLRLPFGLKVERDMHFEPLKYTLEEVYNKIKSGGHI